MDTPAAAVEDATQAAVEVARWTVSHKCLTAVIAGIAGADVWLLRSGHLPLSTVIRKSKWLRAGIVYLAFHLLFDLPFDPLHRAAQRLQAKA